MTNSYRYYECGFSSISCLTQILKNIIIIFIFNIVFSVNRGYRTILHSTTIFILQTDMNSNIYALTTFPTIPVDLLSPFRSILSLSFAGSLSLSMSLNFYLDLHLVKRIEVNKLKLPFNKINQKIKSKISLCIEKARINITLYKV